MREPEQFSTAVSGVRLSADFLAPQRTATRVEQFQSVGWALDFHEAQVKARIFGPLPQGWASIGLMRSPAPSSWYGQAAGPGMLFCNPPGHPIDGWITPGFSCMAVNVPVNVWEQCRALSGAHREEFGPLTAVFLPPPHYTELERSIRTLRNLLRSAARSPAMVPYAMAEAGELVLRVVTSAWELSSGAPAPSESHRNRLRLARRGESWMREHLSEPVRVPDVCTALGVSRRELEYAFRTAFDQSPRDFLQALRLNAIRRMLRKGTDQPVSRIALDFGMTHLGRLSGQYRHLFGESPSATTAD